MENLKNIKLKEHEKVLRVVRHHAIIIVPHLIICFIILVLNFFLMYYLFLQGWWGVALFGAVIFVVAFYCWRMFFLYRRNKIVITNERLIDVEQSGFFEKFVTDVPFLNIKEVEARIKGIFSTIFRFGSLKITLNQDIAPFEFYKIPKPDEVQEVINGLLVRQGEIKKEALVENDPISLVLAEIKLLSRRQKRDVITRIEAELRAEIEADHDGIGSEGDRGGDVSWQIKV